VVPSTRAGRYVKQPTGYRAFIPSPLPPDPPIRLDPPVQSLLSLADQAVGRLDGATNMLPNPELFVAMYVRQEAVLSSQIEGTQSSLDDVLTFELGPGGRPVPGDIEEVVNYIRAMNYGLTRLQDLPLSLRLIREIHAQLLQGVRGAEKQPGEFRISQNWIGAGRVPLERATFVPPPVTEMWQALDNFERFLHADDDIPVLVRCALAHAQFETIHPFADGNGRVGRLLITFLLCHRRVMQRPLLYLSLYLMRHRLEYYDRLMAMREQGDWEGWLRFFLQGVAETAEEATRKAHAIVRLREDHRALLQHQGQAVAGLRALDLLFQQPLVNVTYVRDHLGVAYVTANKIVEQFRTLGLLEEITGGQRFRIYRYTPYTALFDEQPAELPTTVVQTTEGGVAF